MSDPSEREKLRRLVADISSRAETALLKWNAQFGDRTKARGDAPPNAMADRIVIEEHLRQQLAELENELAVVQREHDDRAAMVLFWDERAVVAMRHSDDVTAMQALQVHGRHVEALQELAGELTILGKLVKSCREALAAPHEQTA